MSRYQANVRACLPASLLRRAAVTAGMTSGLLVIATPARADALSPAITGWATTSVPPYITMFEYVPAKVAPNPPIVVAVHFCSGNAAGEFGTVSGIVSAADTLGFVMIFPQTSNNCWDVGSTKSLTHDGGGDTQAIAEMIQYAITKHGADPNRVYITGSSSGGMMTEAMLAVYPELFKAGAEFSGVAAGCWSSGYDSSNQWSSNCANGSVSMTAAQWGTLARGMDPGYTGYRARLQLWHGNMDTTINYNNLGEGIKQWTNVLGLSTNPTSMDTPMSGYARESWTNSCGFTVLEAWTQQGGGHPTPVDASAVISWFGLDNTGPDPQVAACSDAGASGSSGASGSGGAKDGGAAGSSTGGTSGTGSSGSSVSGSSGASASGSSGVSASGSTGSSGAGSSGAASGSSTGASAGSSSGLRGASGSVSSGAGSGTSGSGAGAGASGSAAMGTAGSGSGDTNEPTSSPGGCSVPTGRGPAGAGAIGAAALLGIVFGTRRRRRT